MYNNIGLPTARGSGTNAYIQRNLAHIPAPRQEFIVGLKRGTHSKRLIRKPDRLKPDEAILEYQRKRKVEEMIFARRERLEEQK